MLNQLLGSWAFSITYVKFSIPFPDIGSIQGACLFLYRVLHSCMAGFLSISKHATEDINSLYILSCLTNCILLPSFIAVFTVTGPMNLLTKCLPLAALDFLLTLSDPCPTFQCKSSPGSLLLSLPSLIIVDNFAIFFFCFPTSYEFDTFERGDNAPRKVKAISFSLISLLLPYFWGEIIFTRIWIEVLDRRLLV